MRTISLNKCSEAEFIKFIRESLGLTQKQFGELIGKSPRTVADYESGKTMYNAATLKKLCNIKKIKIDFVASK
ncbi:MAG: helix-turn-helix transcriptional regulator [Firmicutes bacterium]|nr:helix-turn-helix transcriptional regulator [Bacillota bacterium]